MTDEYFYGVTLSADNKEVSWDPESKPETSEVSDYPRNHKLIVKQCLLGPEAKDDELNVVQVETLTLRDTVRLPIAILDNKTRQMRLNLEFPDPPVTFALIQGSGPVHIAGNHLLGQLEPEELEEEIDELEMAEEESEDDKVEDEDEGNPKKKQKLSNSKTAAAKAGGAGGGIAANAKNGQKKK